MIIDAETVTKCIHTKLTIQWSVLVSPCTDTMLSIASCQAQLRDNLKESRDSMPAAETQSRRVNQSPRLLIIQRWRLRCCRGERPRPSRVESMFRSAQGCPSTHAHCGATASPTSSSSSSSRASPSTHTHNLHNVQERVPLPLLPPPSPPTNPPPAASPPAQSPK